MSFIFSKDSVTKQFPELAQDYVQPIFIEAGIMADRKGRGKSKSCQIYISNAGIYFLRPVKLSKAYKVSLFISIDTVSELYYDNPKRRTIVYKNVYAKQKNEERLNAFYECPHIEESIECIITARNIFIPNAPSLVFTGFPSTPTSSMQVNAIGRTSLLRYVNICSKYEKAINIKNPFFQSLVALGTTNYRFLMLNSECDILKNPGNLFYIISSEPIHTLYLKNAAPYCACGIVNSFIKQSPIISKIVFDGYTTLIPEQLRMENLKPKAPLTFAFRNCQFNEKCFMELIDNLSKLNGDIHRFTIENMRLTPDSWNFLINAFDTCRSWSTLEYLELNGIDLPNVSNEQIKTSILIILRRCRFIQQLSISNWVQPISFNIESLVHHIILAQLILQGLDFSEPFAFKGRLPVGVVYFDFSHSKFSSSSLQSFFRFLPCTSSPIAVNFSDIDMPIHDFQDFYSALPTFNNIHIRGLDWSGNPLDSSSIVPFCQYFFDKNSVAHLKIDRIFNASTFENFRLLINTIGANRLLSLSVCGTPSDNFSGSFNQFLDVVSGLGNNLILLHLDGQKITNDDSPAVFDYIRKHSSIQDFSIDDTNLPDESSFFDFYSNVFAIGNITILGRPNRDLNRLFGPDLASLNDKDRFSKFKDTFGSKKEPLQESLFAYLFCKSGDPQKYVSFSRCPEIFDPLENNNPFCLRYISPKQNYTSFLQLSRTIYCNSLNEIQNKFLTEPTKFPNYKPNDYGSLKLDTPKGISPRGSDLEMYADYMSGEGNVNGSYQFSGMAGVQMEPLAETPEMKEALELLTGFFDDEEEQKTDVVMQKPQQTKNFSQQTYSQKQPVSSNYQQQSFSSQTQQKQQQSILPQNQQQKQQQSILPQSLQMGQQSFSSQNQQQKQQPFSSQNQQQKQNFSAQNQQQPPKPLISQGHQPMQRSQTLQPRNQQQSSASSQTSNKSNFSQIKQFYQSMQNEQPEKPKSIDSQQPTIFQQKQQTVARQNEPVVQRSFSNPQQAQNVGSSQPKPAQQQYQPIQLHALQPDLLLKPTLMQQPVVSQAQPKTTTTQQPKTTTTTTTTQQQQQKIALSPTPPPLRPQQQNAAPPQQQQQSHSIQPVPLQLHGLQKLPVVQQPQQNKEAEKKEEQPHNVVQYGVFIPPP